MEKSSSPQRRKASDVGIGYGRLAAAGWVPGKAAIEDVRWSPKAARRDRDRDWSVHTLGLEYDAVRSDGDP